MWLLFSLPLPPFNHLCRHNHRRIAILEGKRRKTPAHYFYWGVHGILKIFPTKQKLDTLLIHSTAHINKNVP